VQCATEIARALTAHPQLQLRMGVHSGPVTRVPDINGNENVSGAGINMAQRVMDCGDGGHILLSAVAAEMVQSFESWGHCLADLGEVIVKHGVKVHVYNLVMSDIGNSAIPEKVRASARVLLPNLSTLANPTPTPKISGDFDPASIANVASAAKGPRPKIGVGKTVSLIFKRRGAPADERIARVLEEELKACGFNIRADRQQSFGIAWATEVEKQIAASDAVVFLLSSVSCQSEMFEYEVETAGKIVGGGGTEKKPRLLPVRIAYEAPLTDAFYATLAHLPTPMWYGPSDDEKIVQSIIGAFTETVKPAVDPSKREKAGGAVPLNSAYYIVRSTDDEFTQAIARQDSIVLVKGGRQMGKTSLLARGLQQARQNGGQVVLTDFQSLSASNLENTDTLYRALAQLIADQLDLDVFPDDVWNEKRSANMNLERYLRKEVLGAIGEDTPLVWGLDEVDRLFMCDFGSEVFGLFRSWHNKRSLDPTGPWSRLTLAIAYATEAHLFITDMNQSPFNVGTRLTLDDFSIDQVAELNHRYGQPLAPVEIGTFHDLAGGQPFLTRRGYDELTAGTGLTFDRFAEEAGRDEGVYGDHLRRILLSLTQEPTLVTAVKTMLTGQPCPSSELFYRLRTAGLIRGDSAAEAKIRCQVYQEYLTRHLL